MSKMTFSEEMYYLELQQVKEEILSKQQIVDFLKDKTSIDYYCNDCEKSKTFIQNKDYYTFIINNKSDFAVYKSYDLLIENDEMKYKKDNYSMAALEKVYIYNYSNYFIFKNFICPKCDRNITMVFLITSTSIKKIFQSYTSTLLSSKEIRKFEKTKLLNDEDIREIDKANNCINLSMNVGAFVYLRRVYENILDRIYEQNKDKITIKDNKVFKTIITKEKVNYLVPYLPVLMTEESSQSKYNEIYKLLSEGIHTLSEEICSSLFNILEEIIIMILEKEYENKNQKDYLSELSKNYNEIFNPKLKDK